MKTTLKTLAICAVVVGAFCFGKSFNTAAEEYPELMAAKNHLTQGKTNLQKAASDFDGHRVKAIEHLDKAINEINLAVEYADKHK